MNLTVDNLKTFFHDQIEFWGDEAKQSKDDPAYLMVVQGEISRLETLQTRLNQIADAFEVHGMGLELRNDTLDEWCIVLPDPSGKGRVRFQTFGEDGFRRHVIRESVEDLLLEALYDGFYTPDCGVLERIAGTQTWRKGMVVQEFSGAASAETHAFNQEHLAERRIA